MNIVEKTEILPKKTVCFIGDSITHNGTFIKELAQSYLDSENKTSRYEFYNCGISGDTVRGAIVRLESDILSYKPDIAFVMFGMNDIGQDLYIKENYNQSIEEKRQTKFRVYKMNMTTLVDTLTEKGIEVILCTPTPYDDVTNKVYECNVGLEQCAKIARELALEKNLKLVDLYKHMYDLRGTKYWGNADPIHPNGLGHHVIAQSIMYDLGYIDKIDTETAMKNFDDLNQKRHTKSYDYRMFMMVELGLQGSYKTTEEKLAQAKKLQSQQKDYYWKSIYQLYIDNCGKDDKMLEEVINLTEEMSCKD